MQPSAPQAYAQAHTPAESRIVLKAVIPRITSVMRLLEQVLSRTVWAFGKLDCPIPQLLPKAVRIACAPPSLRQSSYTVASPVPSSRQLPGQASSSSTGTTADLSSSTGDVAVTLTTCCILADAHAVHGAAIHGAPESVAGCQLLECFQTVDPCEGGSIWSARLAGAM